MSKKEKNNNLQDLDLFLKNKINGSEFLARLLNNNNFEMLFTIFEKEAYLDPEKDSITPLEYDIYKALYFLKIEDYHRSNKYFHKCLDTHPLNEICHEYLSKIPKEINKKIFKIKLVGDINTTNNIFLNLVKSLVKIDTIELSIDTEITSYHKVPFLNSIRKAKSDDQFYLTIKVYQPDKLNKYLNGRYSYPSIEDEDEDEDKVRDTAKIALKSDKQSIYTIFLYDTEEEHFNKEEIYYCTAGGDHKILPSTLSKKCMQIISEENELVDNHSSFMLDCTSNIIPHGVNCSDYYPLSEKEIINIKQKYNIHPDDYVFFNSGQGSKFQNIELLINSFLKLPQKNIKLIIKVNVLSFRNTAPLLMMYITHSDNIIFINENLSPKHTNQLYNICDCYISCSSYETFNLPVLESASIGKIVIYPDNSAPQEYIYNDTSIKIKSSVNDDLSIKLLEKDIIHAMEKALEMKIPETIINKALVYYQKFNWDVIVKDIIETYCDVTYNLFMFDTLYHSKYRDDYYNQLLDCKKENIHTILLMKNIDKYPNGLQTSYLDIREIHEKLLSYEYIHKKEDKILSLDYYSKLLTKKNIIHSLIIDSLFKHSSINYIDKEYKKQFINILNKIDFNNYICGLAQTYFFSTYLPYEISKKIKSTINKNIQKLWEKNNIFVENKVTKKNNKYNLCIFSTTKDLNTNVVSRYIRHHINGLSKLFNIDICLLDTSSDDKGLKDGSIRKLINKASSIEINEIYAFRINPNESISVYSDNTGKLLIDSIENLDKVINNNYLACYIPVIGCNIESIYLSNLKIAPIQFGGYGHPISSFGSKNNYFIMSNEIEKNIEKYYTEKPILLKGLTTYPDLEIKDFKLDNKPDPVRNYILISSTFRKVTPEFIDCIKSISKEYYHRNKSNEKLIYNIYGEWINQAAVGGIQWKGDDASLMSLKHDIFNVPMSYEYHEYYFRYYPDYNDYMYERAKCRVSFDTYPYGGCSTIIENLKMQIPVIVYAGEETTSNFGSFIYNRLGLDELIVYSYEEYIELALKLLFDDDFYNQIIHKLKNVDEKKYVDNNEELIHQEFTKLIKEHTKKN